MDNATYTFMHVAVVGSRSVACASSMLPASCRGDAVPDGCWLNAGLYGCQLTSAPAHAQFLLEQQSSAPTNTCLDRQRRFKVPAVCR